LKSPAFRGRRREQPDARARRAGLASAAATALFASCSSTSNGLVSLQARGAVSIETAGAVTAGALAGAGGRYSGSTYDFEGLGYGAGAAINTPWIDVIGGFDERRYSGHGVPEVNVGLRKRFGPETSPLYVFALARSSRSDTDGEEGFNGSAIGLGLIVQVHRHWFVDVNAAYERTSHLELDDGRSNYEQGVFQIGLGYAF
jgi:hypothetical protein